MKQQELKLNNRPRNIVAIDIGYGNTKMVCGHDLDKAGRPRWTESLFPSIAPEVVVDEEASGFAPNPDRILIEYKGQRYYTGPKATSGVVSRVIEQNYIETDMHEILLRTALHLAMRESRRVMTEIDMLVLGLPVSGHASQRSRLKSLALQERKVPLPKSLHHDKGSQEMQEVTVKVKDCIVVPQPFGSLRLAAQDLPSDDAVFTQGMLAMVVDPGYRTLDWFVAEAMSPDVMLSGSYDGGVSSILRDVSQLIGFEHGTGSLEFDMVERGLKTGQINLGHQVIDMQPYQQKLPVLAGREVGTFLTRIGSRRSNIATVIVTGGGAQYYEQAIREKLPGCRVMTLTEPVMSNARGYWLTGCDAMET